MAARGPRFSLGPLALGLAIAIAGGGSAVGQKTNASGTTAKTKDNPPRAAAAGKTAQGPPGSGSRTRSSDAAPAILSKDDEARRKRSTFLLPPGSSPSDRYDSDVDSTDPPWRQTSFFGIRARGQFFVFVLD